MQTVETLNEGLKRAYTLKISAKDIDAKVDAEVKRVAPQIRMPGFRPGKVPTNLVRKMHGEALAQDALNSSIQEGIQSLIAKNKLRPAMSPSVSLEGDYAPGGDAEVKVELEVLPDVPTPSIEGIALERLVVPVPDEAVDEQLKQLASQQKRWEDAEPKHKAATGDQVTMDFAGKVDGVAFDGGTGEGMAVELGSGRLIPGFEEQLVGVKLGDEKTLNVTFPADYGVADLAAKDATFDVKVTAIKTASDPVLDDALATNLGLQSLEQLKGLLKGQLEQQNLGLTRTYMKRKLLDQLAAGHDFPVPPSMVAAEFDQIWAQLQHEAEHEEDVDAAKAELEAERGDYQAIAERRVRLGLLLSEIGNAHGVEVSPQEMNQLIMQAAQQYTPADRERFIAYVRQEPLAAAQLRAPLFEDKVVDFLFDKAEVTEREVTREELEAAIESEEGAIPHVHGPDCGHDHHHDHDHGAKPKKAAKAKQAEAEAVTEEAPAAEEKPAKKAAAKKAKAEEAPAVEDVTEEAPKKKAKKAEAPADEAAAEKPKKAAKKKAD
ncbi:trigger factor [Sphingomonas sp.]|uniref:trigger factor n=1 Tax=Sphingomonas sp. TaxID=28214 RepID=UPI001B2453F0|nr:trigger factor [Sphingomonas sp.]MBO9712572.1 trigger factor [Sphingomonas sp.]